MADSTVHAAVEEPEYNSNHLCNSCCLTQLRCIKQDVTGFMHEHETFVGHIREDITNVQNSQEDSKKSLKALLDMVRKQNKVIDDLEGKLNDLSSDIQNIEEKTSISSACNWKLYHRIRSRTQNDFKIAHNAHSILQSHMSILEKGLGDALASQRVQKGSITELHHDIEDTRRSIIKLDEIDTQMKLTQDVVSTMERDFRYLWNQVHELLNISDSLNHPEQAMANTLAGELSYHSDSFDASEITLVPSFADDGLNMPQQSLTVDQRAVYTASRLVDAGRCTWIMLKKVICLATTCPEGHFLLACAIIIIVLFVSGRSTSQNDLGSPRVPGRHEAPLWHRLAMKG